MLILWEESKVITVLIEEVAKSLIEVKLVIMERVDALATVKQSCCLVTSVNDCLEELQMITFCKPLLHESDSFINGSREWTTVNLASKVTVVLQELIENTIVSFLAVAEQFGAVIAALDRHDIEYFLPSIDKVIEHFL